MQLIVDFGNTRTKVYLFDGGALLAHHALEKDAVKPIVTSFFDAYPIKKAIWAASGEADMALVHFMDQQVATYRMGWDLNIPFGVNYETKETLGMDRLALVSGAQAEFGDATILIV